MVCSVALDNEKNQEDMIAKKSPIIYILCLYLVGTAIYTLITLKWSASTDLLAKAVIFQSLKLSAGIALFLRYIAAPYLLGLILLWSVVSTGLGFKVSPISGQSMLTIAYVFLNLMFLAAVVLYSITLKRKGYYLNDSNS